MCLILLSYRDSKDHPLVLAANRDEFYRRPTRTMQFWPDQPELLAGQDLREGGTWLGVTRTGRFAAVTNYREPPKPGNNKLSRGQLTLDFLRSTETAEVWLNELSESADRYNGFNLLVGDSRGLWYLGNRAGEGTPRAVEPGVYGLSNEVLDSPWFKVTEGKRALIELCQGEPTHDAMIEILRNGTRAREHQLPNTGVGARLERMLSPRFIRSPWYGTRASTAVTIRKDGQVKISEQNYTHFGLRGRRKEFAITLSEPDRW